MIAQHEKSTHLKLQAPNLLRKELDQRQGEITFILKELKALEMRVNAGQYIPENWEEELGLVSTESAMTTYQQRLDEGEET